MNQLKHIILLVSLLITHTAFAVKDYHWKFPNDHGAHHTFNTEWWYFTGHLKTESKKAYGFELTFFRVDPNFANDTKTLWTPKQLYFAHFALTDEHQQRFEFFERQNRQAFNMAGASSTSLDVWNGDWNVSLKNNRLLLQTKTNTIKLDLDLNATSPIILQGQNGYSQKNHEGSQYSFYYSMPRLIGSGYLKQNNNTEKITHASVWFDHEFFNSNQNKKGAPQQQSVGDNYIGWDWFALQFDNGDNLMLAQVRHKKNQNDHFYFGTLSKKDGTKIKITSDMLSLNVLKTWKSKQSQISYPSKWKILIPKFNIDVTVTPTLAEQELRLKHLGQLSYWEGRSKIEGSHTGFAYVELVGYESKN